MSGKKPGLAHRKSLAVYNHRRRDLVNRERRYATHRRHQPNDKQAIHDHADFKDMFRPRVLTGSALSIKVKGSNPVAAMKR